MLVTRPRLDLYYTKLKAPQRGPQPEGTHRREHEKVSPKLRHVVQSLLIATLALVLQQHSNILIAEGDVHAKWISFY